MQRVEILCLNGMVGDCAKYGSVGMADVIKFWAHRAHYFELEASIPWLSHVSVQNIVALL